ncbi:MAG: hypothetical protein HYR72_03610 [Deltaproteobacteria bacterium]|nr:hypothetical protein [Deltaproteobacteria bacterium]MBI3388725.1 hypothetical protein [Deltaproteobacteria bacterium]
MSLAIGPEHLPLPKDADGVIRVGGSRANGEDKFCRVLFGDRWGGQGEAMNFESSFRRFVSELPYAEIYDNGSGEGKTADYLFFERRLIAELKCLENDPSHQIQSLADQLVAQRGIVLYGSTSFVRLFQSQPDSAAINDEARRIASVCLRKHVRKANEQIRDTRDRERLADSLGLLIVANVENRPLTEEVFLWALGRLLRGRKRDGSRVFSSIDAALYIPTQEQHFVRVSEKGPSVARCWWVYRDNGPRAGYLRRMIEIIIGRWAAFNGAPYVSHSESLEYLRSGRFS